MVLYWIWSNDHTCSKQLSLGEYLEKIRKHFVDIIEELSRRYSWDMFLLLGLYCKYNKSNKRFEKKVFIAFMEQSY